VAAVSRKSLEVALLFDEEPYTYSDVLVTGALRGEWASLTARQRADGGADGSLTGQAAARIVDFRRAHRLEAASDLRHWLSGRDLDGNDLLRYARGEACGWWAEAVFSGYFGRWAEALERWLIVQRLAGTRHLEADDDTFWLIEASGVLEVASGTDRQRAGVLARAFGDYQSWAASAISESEIDQLIGRRKIGWTRLEFDELIFTSAAAAAEALACVAEDGESLAAVAARAGTAVTARSAWQEDLPAGIGSLLLALEPGQVGVPSGTGGLPELVRLRAAVPPATDDDQVRELAAAELRRVILAASGAGHIRRVGAW